MSSGGKFGFDCLTCNRRCCFPTREERDAYQLTHGQCVVEVWRTEAES